MTTPRTRQPRDLRLFALGLASQAMLGCGYTAHDEYYASRQDSFGAEPGSGDLIAVAPLESLLVPPTLTASAGRSDARE